MYFVILLFRYMSTIGASVLVFGVNISSTVLQCFNPNVQKLPNGNPARHQLITCILGLKVSHKEVCNSLFYLFVTKFFRFGRESIQERYTK